VQDIYKQLAAVIDRHNAWDYAGGLECHCGEKFDAPINEATGRWSDHLAQQLVDQLGLREETRTNVMSSAGQTTDTRTGVTTHHSDMRYDLRYVTDWRTLAQTPNM
jgi:hypothetical protein